MFAYICFDLLTNTHTSTQTQRHTHMHTVTAILLSLLSVVWVFSARTKQLFTDATKRRTASRQGGTRTTSLTVIGWNRRCTRAFFLHSSVVVSNKPACMHVQTTSFSTSAILTPIPLPWVSPCHLISPSLSTAARQVYNMEENLARSYARKVFAGSRDCGKVADGPSPPAADPCPLTSHAPTGI